MMRVDKPKENHFTEVIQINDFRKLWFGQICSQLAANSLLFVIGLMIYQTTQSNTAVSILFIVYGIPSLFFGIAAGSIVDRLDRKFVLFFSDVIRSLLLIPFIFLANDIKSIYVFVFLFAVVNQFYVPAEAPFIPLIVPERLRVSANSLFSFTFFSSLAIGSILAGPFLRIFGTKGVFIFLSIVFMIASINIYQLSFKFDKNNVFERVKRLSIFYIFKRILLNMLEGIKYVQKTKDIKESLFLLTGTQVVLSILGALGPGFADKILKIDVRDASIVVTGPVVLGIILGALWVGSVGTKIPRKVLISRGVLYSGFILITVSLAVALTNIYELDKIIERGIIFPIVVLLFFLLGVSNSFLDVPSNTTMQEKSSGEMRSRVYGIMAAAVGGLGILPVVLGGILADNIGVGKVIFCLGLIILLYGIRRIRQDKLSLISLISNK